MEKSSPEVSPEAGADQGKGEAESEQPSLREEIEDLPDGKRKGVKTAPPEKIGEIKERAEEEGKPIPGKERHPGTWVELPDGSQVGSRESDVYGPSVDFYPPNGESKTVHGER